MIPQVLLLVASNLSVFAAPHFLDPEAVAAFVLLRLTDLNLVGGTADSVDPSYRRFLSRRRH